jgi:hypothetical protein
MEFLLTSYIYPLERPVELSPTLRFSLDNPRTEHEINVIRDYLSRSFNLEDTNNLPLDTEDGFFSIKSALFEFKNRLSCFDPVVRQRFDSFTGEDIFAFLASIWIVARFDNDGLGESLRQEYDTMNEKGMPGIILLEEDHPLVVRTDLLGNFCCLLSLLIHTESNSYFGSTLLARHEVIDLRQPSLQIQQDFLMFGSASFCYPDADDELRWRFFPYARDEIDRVVAQINNAFGRGLEEKLLYIGGLLKLIGHETHDNKIRLLLLTSILELVLTHNPDSNRFNIEESINKQFQLKASILVYLNDKSKEIDSIKKRLKTIYQQRSNIVHGNFKELDKYISSLPKKEGQEEYFDSLIGDAYSYARAVLEELLKDQGFVEFLKAN